MNFKEVCTRILYGAEVENDEPTIEKEPEMTPEEYCRISREYKERAIEAMRIDFETRVENGVFCVRDVVTIKTRYLGFFDTTFRAHKYHDDYYEMKTRIEQIVDFDGIKFAQVNYMQYNHCNGERICLHVVYLPVYVLTAKWEDNKPDRC